MADKNPPNSLGTRSLLSTEPLSAEQVRKILDTSFFFKDHWRDQALMDNPVAGKTVVLFFFEPSTRTRVSFELAAKRLGASTVFLGADGSSVGKGETLYDTARTLEAMEPDVIVLRHPSAGAPHFLNEVLKVPVINAGDGFHEHPTQALLDAMTIEEFKGPLPGRRVLIVGDIAHSRVARSNIYLLKTLGADVSVCGPPTLMPPKAEKLGVKVFYDLDEAVVGQDVIILLRVQFERFEMGQVPSRGEYHRFYGMNARVLDLCKKEVLVMHPGPINRGLELSTEIADGPRSVILNQVANGVVSRMALLHLLTGGRAMKRGAK
jgi:aspartate carbamoyltransferase catalytic subunit